MSDFGDKDVFDVWDEGDPIELKIHILERLVTELQAVPNDNRRHEALRLFVKLQRNEASLHSRLEALQGALDG